MPVEPAEPNPKSKTMLIVLAGVALLIAIFSLGAFLALNQGGSNKGTNNTTNSNTSNQQTQEQDSAAILLDNLAGITFGPYTPANGLSGDFVFAIDAAVSEMILFPFGQQICEQGSCKTLPELGMQGLKLGTKVIAAAGGKVVEVREQGSNDYAVSTVFDNSSTALNYDHVSNVAVRVGDTVSSGDTLGEVAAYGSGTYGRVELMIQKVEGQNTTYLCPVIYLDTSVKGDLTADLKQFFSDWNSFYGKEVHDLSTMNTPGCLKATLTLAETEQ